MCTGVRSAGKDEESDGSDIAFDSDCDNRETKAEEDDVDGKAKPAAVIVVPSSFFPSASVCNKGVGLPRFEERHYKLLACVLTVHSTNHAATIIAHY